MNNPHLRRHLAGVLAGLAVFALAPAADKAPALPAKVTELMDVLFRPAAFEQGQLAPDGAHFSFLRTIDDKRVLDSYEFKTGKFYRLTGKSNVNSVFMAGSPQGIGSMRWLGSDQLMITDSIRDSWASGIWIADARLMKVRKLELPNISVQLLDSLPQNPDTALFVGNHETIYGTIWRLNKKTLTLYETIGSNPGKAIEWETDLAGEPRLAMITDPDGGWSYMHRPVGGKDWAPLNLPSRSSPVTFDASGQTVLVASPGPEGRYQLQPFSVPENKFTDAPTADPVFDVLPFVIADPKTGIPMGLSYFNEKQAFLWLNGQYAQVHATLQKSFPGAIVLLRGVIDSGEVLFSVRSDTAPVVLYRYNPAKHEIHSVISSMPEAGKRPWAAMQPVSFVTRDGWTVHGYLTLPPGRKADQKVPLVALSHGGPSARDYWGFEPEVQFLAGLGYGVLQVNYRGSTGYGRRHELENILEVHAKSVDDVVDGIRWAIAQGYADPKRIVAYGGSYGGYISLAIATRYPDLLAATVGFAGVYDWAAQFKENKKYGGAELFRWRKDYYPDFAANADRYRALSPAFFGANVRCPVLLLHGGADNTVDVVQSNAMARSLRDAGKSVEVIKDAVGIHGLPNEAARRTFYTNVAAFLLKNVPPDPAP
ncbi:MAG: alpha/beta fold hydrolase [Lacunisphaera sp.]|nr:alpha/beta fold hydrolase [Lacunisphaera sp.]